MASVYVVVMGTLIGILTWIFLAFKVPGIPFGRTLGTLGGAVLTLAFTVLSPADAFAAINIETIALLFGTMVMTIILEREGFFQYFVRILLHRCTTPFSLLARLCFASGILSALMTNDTVCVFFTPVVVELCELHQLPHGPFLIALATSANIGSTLTPVGNPQNMIIASLSGISYGDFIIYIGPATLVTLVMNVGLLWLFYGKQMRGTEIRVCNGRFVRMTEEEMAALKGKDWEETMKRQKEDEQRRLAERKKKDQESLDSQQGGLGQQLLELDGQHAGSLKAEEDKQQSDRGYVPPGQLALHIRAANVATDERSAYYGSEKKDEQQYDQATAPAGNALEAERMARKGAVDEEAKVDRDVEKVEQMEAHEAVIAEAKAAKPRVQQSNGGGLPEKLPALLHEDSVAIVIHQLQKEQRRKDKDKRRGYNNNNNNNNNSNGEERNNQTEPGEPSKLIDEEEEDDDDDDDEMDAAHRKVRTRVADYHHPRKQGRLLVQLPPELSASTLVRLQRHQQRRKLREAKRADGMQPTSSEANVHASVDANEPNDVTALTASASSPFSCLGRCLPVTIYSRLLLVPLPSKLVIFTLILLGTVGAFAGGVNLGWAAVGGCAAMLAVDWRDPDRTLTLVDWPLLVFFTSLFVVTAGFSATDLPKDAWNALRGSIDVATLAGLVLYSVIVIVGSNTVSNVPLVLLLGPSIPTISNPQLSWLLLSFVSTVAGNLTLVGSVANLIVVSRAKSWYALSFWEYFRFGFPSTILIGVVGIAVVKGMSMVI